MVLMSLEPTIRYNMTCLAHLTFIFALIDLTAAQGQVKYDPALNQDRRFAKNILGGVYSSNITLYFRNSPYRVTTDLIVEYGATLTIETGVQIYFDTGIGLKVRGALQAIGNEFAHIQMLPYQQQVDYDNSFPVFRLTDGDTVRQGRLQALFRDRWRSVCTMVTNWTSIDMSTACRSMGYSDGGFYKWYLRNNDTYPFVLPRPGCHSAVKSLWDCPGLKDPNSIRLSENLCQGEDDLGIICWGQPTFRGWARHWKGIEIFNSPYKYVSADPDQVAVHKESLSRLEFVDILYAGYDASTKNTTAALWIEGVAPIMNGILVERSARDGLYIYEPCGPVMIANSTFSWNRGHGIVVDNTTDGRVFINMTRIENNYGDGIWYRQKIGSNLLNDGISIEHNLGVLAQETPRADICIQHSLPPQLFFPHLLKAHIHNGTLYSSVNPPPCWIAISLPSHLAYTYSVQFVHVRNMNPSGSSSTYLVICDATKEKNGCGLERLRIPIVNRIYPQTVSLKSEVTPMIFFLEHNQDENNAGYIFGDVEVLFKVHASVADKAFYGLNITNTIINGNIGNGVFTNNIRERTAFSNVTIRINQGTAGFLVKDGAADIWLNDTIIQENWGDGINVSYAGGAITLNGTRLEKNRWRGAAFHFNDSSPFLALHQEIVFKGRPSNNIFYFPTVVSNNRWGGVLVGNFCFPLERNIEPKVLINWVEFLSNLYHPALEIHTCQCHGVARTVVDVTGNRIEGNTGVGLRMAPAVNVLAFVNSNQFLNNSDTTLFIRNADHPELWTLKANVTISKNAFKFNRGKSIVSIGLNEDAPAQQLIFNQQNEVRENVVFNPFPDLKPRSTPYAAMVVSSSNVIIRRNCFKNPQAAYEIGTELVEHRKRIDARENNWGSPQPAQFMNKIFDQFYRYSLAVIEIGPYAAVCNQRNPHITFLQEYFRQFRNESQPFVLGGTIYENHDLATGRCVILLL